MFLFKKNNIFIFFITLIFVSVPFFASAAVGVPNIISYQGRLTNSSGQLLGGGGTTYYFKFSIWDNPTVASGAKLWPSTTPGTTSLTVSDGVFNVNIGDTGSGYPDALTYNFQDNDTVYLQIEVSSDNVHFETLGPRQRITSSGSAINAQTLAGLSAGVGANNILKLDSSGQINIAGSILTAGSVQGGTGLATGTGILINTNGVFSGNLIDLQVGGVSKFSIDQNGNIFSNGSPFTGGGGGGIVYTATSGLLLNGITHAFSLDLSNPNTWSSLQTFSSGLTAGGTLTFSGLTTNGGIVYTNGSGVVTQTGAGVATTVLHGGTTPSYSAVSLTADVSGVLPVANGGTGTSTLTGILYGNGSSVSSATSSNIISVLGFTPYNATNPAGYITSAGVPVSSVFGRTGAVSLLSADVSGALGFTPYDSANPAGYITATSTTTFTNKSGNISQWTNDSNYITSAGAPVQSVSNNDGTLTLSATSGSIVASLNLGNANTWTAAQTFGNGVTATGTITFSNLITGGGLLYTNSSGVVSQTAASLAHGILHGGSTPSFSAIDLASADVTGVLGVANGGLGTSTTPTVGGLLYSSNGLNYLNLAIGSQGQILTVNSSGVPTWADNNGGTFTGGTVLQSGWTGVTGTTYNSSSLADFVRQVFFPSLAPTVAFTGGTTREWGAANTGLSVTYSIAKNTTTNNVTSIKITTASAGASITQCVSGGNCTFGADTSTSSGYVIAVDSSTIGSTTTIPNTNTRQPSAGTLARTVATAANTSAIFTLTVTNANTANVVSNTTFSYVPATYYGLYTGSDNLLTITDNSTLWNDVKGLGGGTVHLTGARTLAATSFTNSSTTTSEYFYIAWPSFHQPTSSYAFEPGTIGTSAACESTTDGSTFTGGAVHCFFSGATQSSVSYTNNFLHVTSANFVNGQGVSIPYEIYRSPSPISPSGTGWFQVQ